MWGFSDVDTLLLCRVGRKLVLESGGSLVAEEGGVAAERNPQVSSRPREKPTAPRREGTSSRTLGLLRAAPPSRRESVCFPCKKNSYLTILVL